MRERGGPSSEATDRGGGDTKMETILRTDIKVRTHNRNFNIGSIFGRWVVSALERRGHRVLGGGKKYSPRIKILGY